jgi:hypothetical protein
MSRQLLGPIFDNESKNHNKLELLFPLLPFLAHLNKLIILIVQLMDKITLNANINALNVVIPHISNGAVLFTPVKPATKQHLDTHHEHVMEASMMMDLVAISI